MVRAGGGRYKDHLRDLESGTASQRRHWAFGNSVAAYHERENQQATYQGRHKDHSAAAYHERENQPATYHERDRPSQPPAERAPEREIFQKKLLQCSDCRQFKEYDFLKPAQKWSTAARRCIVCHDDLWDLRGAPASSMGRLRHACERRSA